MSIHQTMFEKLELNDERNLLIQGLPSSIEKQFAKLSYSKNVTPLLRSKKVDFVLVFAVNAAQLTGIIKDVIPALREDTKIWVAYPKNTSKIVSDLNRLSSWCVLAEGGYENCCEVTLDHVWGARRFAKGAQLAAILAAANCDETTDEDIEEEEEEVVEVVAVKGTRRKTVTAV